MKHIYPTLVIFFSLFILNNNASAQIAQSFANAAVAGQLSSQCWSFDNTMHNANPLQGGSGLMNSESNNGAFAITTPKLHTTTSLNVTISYVVLKATGGSKLFIESVAGTTTELDKINLTQTGAAVYNKTLNVQEGIQAIKVRTSGTVDMKILSLNINAPYAYVGGCSSNALVLPVKLNTFMGKKEAENVKLSWTVSENETGDYFEIEKSLDGVNFQTAAIFFATDKNGNEFYPVKLNSDNSKQYFRLKVINKNGLVSYSKILVIGNQAEMNNNLKVNQNQLANGLSFSFKTDEKGAYNISMYAMNGSRVLATQSNMEKGTNSVSVNMNNELPKGMYILEVSNGSEKAIAKIVK